MPIYFLGVTVPLGGEGRGGGGGDEIMWTTFPLARNILGSNLQNYPPLNFNANFFFFFGVSVPL